MQKIKRLGLFKREKEGMPENAPENAHSSVGEDAIERSILTVPVKDNPFIAAEEDEEYAKMEREFRDYRRRKVLLKIDSLITGELPEGDIKAELGSIAAEARARAVMVPRILPLAKKVLPKTVKTEVVINYPYAALSKKNLSREVRSALKQGAAASVGISLSAFAAGNPKPLERRLKELKKLSKKAKVAPMMNVCFLNVEQLGKLSKSIKAGGFTGLRVIAGDIKETADAVKLLEGVLGEQCPVEVVGNISDAASAEELFLAGAERIITTEYLTLSRGRLDTMKI